METLLPSVKKSLYVILMMLCSFIFLIPNKVLSQKTTQPQKITESEVREYLQKVFNSYSNQEISFEKFFDANKHLSAPKHSNAINQATNTMDADAARLNDCQVLHSVCGNGDFESGVIDLSEWRGAFGTHASGQPNPFALTEGFSSGPLNSSSARQTIVAKSAGNDPIVPIPQVSPGGGNYALRLGNSVNGYGTEVISKTFQVTAANTIIPFSYAMVFQDPNHSPEDQPAFSVRAYNCAGNELPNICNLGNGSNRAVSDASDAFFNSAPSPFGLIAYKDWSQAQINLSAYIGQVVTLVFTNKDCGLGGHFGYTYIDNLCVVCTSGCPYNASVNMGQTSTCGRGQICLNYAIPSINNTSGNVTFNLSVYQNGAQVGPPMTSPTITTGSSYCFNIDPPSLALNTSLSGFDYVVTANFTINGFNLAPIILGQIPDGQILGSNNDYLIKCNTPPVAVCQPLILPADASCQANALASEFNDGSYDAEADPLLFTVSPSGPYPIGTTNVILTVTDDDGAFTTCATTVTVVDNEPPKAICQALSVTLVNGAAAISAADVDGGSTDNCRIKSISVSPQQFDCSNIGENIVTLTVVDVNGNSSSCETTVTVVGEKPVCTISAKPLNNTYTGGIPTNIYLGYGPQGVTLASTAMGGAPFTYSWSPSAGLSSSTSAAPVFTPTAPGVYTFTLTITNKFGCKTTCNITICVTDVRVPGTNGKKVYVCHVPQGNPTNAHVIEVSVNAVPAHLEKPGHGDRLGKCDQIPCSTGGSNPITTPSSLELNSINVTENALNRELKMKVSNNPTRTSFTIQITSNNTTPITLRVLNTMGTQQEVRNNLAPNTTLQVGSLLKPGSYYIQAIQGNIKRVAKVIKTPR